ncbi:MAG: hypothetical protein QNJ68_13030 [Microcoleaceae cyanobacterium MO_207.B10]|nr:hypothetical protein [Microcoleaceae cyanobacterium MO_207.B10]
MRKKNWHLQLITNSACGKICFEFEIGFEVALQQSYYRGTVLSAFQGVFVKLVLHLPGII